MRRFSIGILFVVLAGGVAVPGCGKKGADDDDVAPPKRVSTGGPKTTVALDPFKGDSWDGIVRGRVVLKGDAPMMAPLAGIEGHNDKDGCKSMAAPVELVEQKWILDKNNNVANAVLFFKAPSGKYFVLKDEDKARKDKVVIDQPHCAYIPHVQAVFPSYQERKEKDKPDLETKSSGQDFIVKNSAKFNHNVSWQGNPKYNPVGNRILKSGDELKIELVPQSAPVDFKCDIHTWMNARVWVFDHPYAAVTKDDGTFEIKNLPTGVDLELYLWHEAGQSSPKLLEKLKLKAGENKLDDISIQAK